MNPFEGPPHSFPRTDGGPGGRNRGGHPRRGPRRRPFRPPAWVRAPLVNLQRSTTTTTSTRNDIRALQPITRFFHPQDPRIPDGQPTAALRQNRLIRDFLHSLNMDSMNYIDWLNYFLYYCHYVYWNSPDDHLALPRYFPLPQTDLPLLIHVSRYHQDFEEEEELGRGGFGRVVRARNKLDGQCYAIKMIIIKEDMGELSLEFCMKEVKTLAELNHPHVVRYHNAWVEDEVWHLQSQQSSATVWELTSDTVNDSSSGSSNENSVPLHPPPSGVEGSTTSDDGVVFQDTAGGEVKGGRASGAVLPYRQWRPPNPRRTLYIKMGLCGESLMKWINDRNTGPSPVVVESVCFRIFRQLVDTLHYLHQKDYMHRDIKPANIFFTLDGADVQLGDFGLARLTAHPPAAPNTTQTPMAAQNYTLNVGTPLYAAPEVKEKNYGQKSDMYGLGIVLLELFMPFQTMAERIHVITKLKDKGYLNPDFIHHWPDIAECIKKLTDADPANRPSALELKSILFPEPLPPPSPTTPTITDEAGARAFSMLTLSDNNRGLQAGATAVEVIQSSYTRVNRLEINQIITEQSVNNSTVRIEEYRSKDERIAVLEEENDALKKKVAALERQLDFERRRNGNASQAAQN